VSDVISRKWGDCNPEADLPSFGDLTFVHLNFEILTSPSHSVHSKEEEFRKEHKKAHQASNSKPRSKYKEGGMRESAGRVTFMRN
jgi:hypothetical protein